MLYPYRFACFEINRVPWGSYSIDLPTGAAWQVIGQGLGELEGGCNEGIIQTNI